MRYYYKSPEFKRLNPIRIKLFKVKKNEPDGLLLQLSCILNFFLKKTIITYNSELSQK